ncbi:MAG TPA: HAD-IA family hydrolase [Candidatus Saccharimonadales bacterium]|nr:HAD-IA family hydrolase [Candidatus Saccharimonadales bacterium]
MGTIIFDFDGTIADTFFIAADVFRKLAKGRHPTDDKEIEQLRSLPAQDAIKRVGAKWWQLPYIIYYARKQIGRRQEEIKPIEGIPAVLQSLHEAGHRMYIVSSNHTKNINHFLERNGLATYFDGTYGGIGLFAKAKTLRKIAQQHNVRPQDCFYVGDEARDIEASRHIGMPCLSVTWGYNNLKGLQRGKPGTVINTPGELLAYFTGK